MLKWRAQMIAAIIVPLDALTDLGELAEVDKALCANMLMDILSGASSKLTAMGDLNIEGRREHFGSLWQAYRRMSCFDK